MPCRFNRATRRMNRVIMRHMSDGTAEFYDINAALIAADVPVTIDHNVEDPADFIERMTIISVLHADLPKFARQGTILMAGHKWQIAGIASDDSQILALKVIKA